MEYPPPICINEISAANDIFVNDYGKREDWIELYNRGKEPIDVAELYFSDEASNPTKYQLDAAPGTNTILQPNDHIVIWCDGRPSLTQLHLPFKLKNKYGVHSTKESIGRFPDGGCSYYVFYHPTIENQNMMTMYDSFIRTTSNSIEGQPSSDGIVSVAYYTIDGKRAQPQNSGFYIRVVYHQDGHASASKVLIKK